VTDLNTKLNGLIKEHFSEAYQSKIKYHLQPLKRVHLYSQTDYHLGSSGNINYIRFFTLLSILILTIVAINFLNISKTLIQSRLVETGVRKVFGATTLRFVLGFLTETTFLIAICLPLALLFVYLAVPLMNQYLGSNISINQLTDSVVFLNYLLLIVLFVLIIGLLPSLRFSSVKPISLLSKQVRAKRRSHANSLLVVVQFCIAIILIISTLYVNRQFHFMISKDPGFDQENVLMVPVLGNDPVLRGRCEVVKEAFLENPAIIAATTSHAIIGTYAERHFVKPEGCVEEMEMYGLGVDADYIPFYGLKLLEGRNFRKEAESDLNAVILNKKAVDVLGWKEAVGRTIDFRGRKGEVIGVVDDFNFFALDQFIRPAYLQQELPKNWLALKYKEGDFDQIRQFVEDKQTELSPYNVPEVYRLSDLVQNQYEGARRSMQLFGIFALLAIVLSCIGLLGIVVEVCQSRVKEIGVRKVNGASVWEVMVLVNQAFFKSLLAAYVIAIPVAWLFMRHWMDGFAYRASLGWWIFALAGLIVFAIASFTVSWKSWKAATRNPVESLRNE
jgi:putative ABC transport system permease protein